MLCLTQAFWHYLPALQRAGLSLRFQVARYIPSIEEVLCVVFSFWFLSKWPGVMYIVAGGNPWSLEVKDKTALKEGFCIIRSVSDCESLQGDTL